jgi:aspartyl-tRNA synthetase
MVINGTEVGGGSVRIHNTMTQLKVFDALGIKQQEANEKFGFLLEALRSGAPPHGGIAFGLDRLVALICGAQSIRDVIPFPKTQRGQCLLTGAPSSASKSQLDELGINIKRQV